MRQKADPEAKECCVIEAKSSLSLIDKALGWKGDRKINQEVIEVPWWVWQECREAASA